MFGENRTQLDGEACEVSNDCQNNDCNGTICDPYSPNQTDGSNCVVDQDCSYSDCHNKICDQYWGGISNGGFCYQTGDCNTSGSTCNNSGVCIGNAGDGGYCGTSYDCIYNDCSNNMCDPYWGGSREGGSACWQGGDCASSNCVNNVCTNTGSPDGSSCSVNTDCVNRDCNTNHGDPICGQFNVDLTGTCSGSYDCMSDNCHLGHCVLGIIANGSACGISPEECSTGICNSYDNKCSEGYSGVDSCASGLDCIDGYCVNNICSNGSDGSNCTQNTDCSGNLCNNEHTCGIPLGITITVTGFNSATTVVNGHTLQINATILPSDASQSVTWSKTNGSGSATINSSGLLTATGVGTVIVRATATDGSGVYGELTVTVTTSSISVTGVSLNEHTATLTVGNTDQLTDIIEPTNATNSSVSWNSSNIAVATVNSSGLVTAISAGTTTITVTTTDGNFTDTDAVTVSAASSPSSGGGGSGGGGNALNLIGNTTNSNPVASQSIIDAISQALDKIRQSILSLFNIHNGVTPAQPITNPPTNLQPTQPPPTTATTTIKAQNQTEIIKVYQKILNAFVSLLKLFVVK